MLFMTLMRDKEEDVRHTDCGDEDAVLARAARSGDGRAFEVLIRKYEKYVYRTAFYTTGNAEDAADLTQEILLKLWHGLPSFRENARFLTWLMKISRNACCDYLRKKQRSLPTLPLDALTGTEDDLPHREPQDLSPDTDPHMAYRRQENTDLVRVAMMQLSAEQREILMMRDIDGASYEMMASVLGLEVGTVKSRLSRARARLRELLSVFGFFES